MSLSTDERTVGELVVERPSRARVFEKLGIDYCCGGKKPLAQACNEKGLSLDAVWQALNDAENQVASGRDWNTAGLGELADHIEQTHHAWLKQELPRLEFITGKVANRHGPNHPELVEVHEVFMGLKAELDQHMMKEERILFPLCRQIESSDGPMQSHCGSVANPIRVMVMEHEDAGDALARMRELTHDYTPPADACNTFRAMLDGLRELELDMHQHIHKENNILFPRAVEAEAKLAG